MRQQSSMSILLAVVLFFSTVVVVWAVPPLPNTFYGKVQVGGADVADGTGVTAWMGSTEAVTTGTPITFPAAGVSMSFTEGCNGQVTVQRRAGEAQVFSQGDDTSVYALDAQGPSNWDPPGDPATEGEPVTLKISDTVAAQTTWQQGAVAELPLAVDALAGDLPYTPANVVLLGAEWDISADCTGYSAAVTFAYDEGDLAGVDEADLAGVARYDLLNNRWEYVAGTVDTGVNMVTISDVMAFSRWRLLASTPPVPVADLSATRSGLDLDLDWLAATQDIGGEPLGSVTYQIYRGADDPFFTPGDTPHTTTGGTSYTDTGAMGDPNTDYFYAVTALDGGGTESAISRRAGMAHLPIAAGWNIVCLWLEPLPDAATALGEVGDADLICRWVGEADIWECHTQGRPFNNFPLEVGQAFFVRADAARTWERAGVLALNPVPVPLHPIWTLIGLPRLPWSMTAEDLLQEASAQGGDCTEMHRWYNGDWQGHVRDEGFNDFELQANEGYFIKCAHPITYLPGRGGPPRALTASSVPLQRRAQQPQADPVIVDVQVTNRRDVAVTVTWRTDRPSTGWVEYAIDLTGFENLSGLVAHDDLGEDTVSHVHHVTLTGLTPDATYSFRVHSGETVDDNEGTLYQVTTKATQLPLVPYLAYGQMETSDGLPAVGVLVRAWLVDGDGNESEPLSTLVDGWGYWNLNLGAGLELPLADCAGVQLVLKAVGPDGSVVELAHPACEVQPAPTAVLTEGTSSKEGVGETYLPLIVR